MNEFLKQTGEMLQAAREKAGIDPNKVQETAFSSREFILQDAKAIPISCARCSKVIGSFLLSVYSRWQPGTYSIREKWVSNNEKVGNRRQYGIRFNS